MDINAMRGSLERSGLAIVTIYEGLPDSCAGWRQAEGKWSLLEILCHLCDEERDDFGMRLRLTIESPEMDWPGIDPQGWVNARDYASQSHTAKLAEFKAARERTLTWLATLRDEDMASLHTHPRFGSMSAGDLLAAWVAHDLLHLAQICRANIARAQELAAPYSTAYAMP